MESLTGTNTENNSEKSAKHQAQNKVSIGKAEFEKLNLWLNQLEESSKGFLSLTRSDLVNFLIREHKTELGQKEMQQIRQYHYDPIRHLNWITPRLKEALASGDSARVTAFQEEIRGIELSVVAFAAAENPTEMVAEKRKGVRKKSKSVSEQVLQNEGNNSDVSGEKITLTSNGED